MYYSICQSNLIIGQLYKTLYVFSLLFTLAEIKKNFYKEVLFFAILFDLVIFVVWLNEKKNV